MVTLRPEATAAHSSMGRVIVFAVVIFSPLLDGGTTHLAVMSIRLMILLLFGEFLRRSVINRQLVWPSLPVGIPVLSFLTLAAVSVVFSPYTNQSWQWLMVLSSYALFLYLVVSFVDQWQHIEKLMIVVIVMGIVEAVWALVQGYAWRMERPAGTFFNPNFLAGYLSVSWTILLSLLVWSRVAWRQFGCPHVSNPTITAVIVAGLGILLCALFVTGSRGGVVAMIVGTGVVLALRFGSWRAVAVSAAIVMCVFAVPNPIRERSISEHTVNPASYSRWKMWEGALVQMGDHPFGVGLGLYQYSFPRYAFPVEGEIARYGKTAQTPHNEYLQMGVELGAVTVVVFGGGVAVVGRSLSFLLVQRLTRWQRSLIVGLAGGIVAMLAHAGLDSNLHEPGIAILLVICVGLLFSAASICGQSAIGYRVVPMRSQPLWGMIAVVLLLALGSEIIRLGVAWSYFETGAQHAQRNNSAEAMASLRFAVALDPGKALYHRALSAQYMQTYAQRREPALARAAVAELELAIELNPLDSRLQGLLGALYGQLADSLRTVLLPEQRHKLYMNSLHAYQRAAALAPFVASYRFEQAKLHSLLGNSIRAEECAEEVITLEPNYLPARVLLAALYLEQKRIDEAKAEFQEIVHRQHRYASWPKNSLEEVFLAVDLTPLRIALDQLRVS